MVRKTFYMGNLFVLTITTFKVIAVKVNKFTIHNYLDNTIKIFGYIYIYILVTTESNIKYGRT